MMKKIFFNKIFIFLILLFLFPFLSNAEVIKKIEIEGNDRIADETIKMLGNIDKTSLANENSINNILIDLYNSNFFKDIKVFYENEILKIIVVENPLIYKINFEGIKAKKNLELIQENLFLKERSSFNEIKLNDDVNQIKFTLKNLGYYFSKIDTFVEELEDNKVNINYKINIGEKAKIKKISFIGNKIFKDGRLQNVIISEEYKFWKIISGKKYLNESLIEFDKKLLKNFYLNKGFYDVQINSSFAKLTGENEFELIYNIDANQKKFFNYLKITM